MQGGEVTSGPEVNAQAPGNPTKTYHLVNQHTFTSKHFEIQHNGQVILWANTNKTLLHKPIINLAADAENGPIIAACKLESFSRSLRFFIGNPDCTDKATWSICECAGFVEKHYSFRSSDGRLLQWKRTHNKDLGGKTFGGRTFKLVDEGGNVLAVYVHTQSVFGKRHQIARFDFYVELGQELELVSLVTMLGIQVSKPTEDMSRSSVAGAEARGRLQQDLRSP
ncbi:hypothetical protein LTR36_003677 [Oleoguttula mirabilis]|uniref:Uncharacterized protein n=1 Tax=Oleoguttula mirabilis TaxID=1507867 RepID=A0AAV9JIW1_9PEZI|nr:hypothetical protein LTR36_003677 [Oleoguttula mirabilis]